MAEEKYPNLDDDGVWLVEHCVALARDEAEWLQRLARFDETQAWYADGQLSAVSWLMWFAKMGRSTAFEKVRVARQLRRREAVAEAFRAGRISYSAARVITRAEDVAPEVDDAFVAVAEAGPVSDIERAVRTFEAYQSQETDPGEVVRCRRGLRFGPSIDGLVKVEGWVTDLEAAELEAALAAAIDSARRAGDDRTSPGGSRRRGTFADTGPDDTGPDDTGPDDTGPDDTAPDDTAPDDTGPDVTAPESPRGDWWDANRLESQHFAGRRLDALLELARAGVVTGGVAASGTDRYLTHVVVGPDGSASLPDGTPFPRTEAARICCDTAVVEHEVGDDGEALRLGRKTRVWNRAQRRAALLRDGGHCRFPGCGRRDADLHHHRWWRDSGATDIDNGYLLCAHHHTLIHEQGYRVVGRPDHQLTFRRADGREIGTSSPTRRARTLR
jgi:hypothetical protein